MNPIWVSGICYTHLHTTPRLENRQNRLLLSVSFLLFILILPYFCRNESVFKRYVQFQLVLSISLPDSLFEFAVSKSAPCSTKECLCFKQKNKYSTPPPPTLLIYYIWIAYSWYIENLSFSVFAGVCEEYNCSNFKVLCNQTTSADQIEVFWSQLYACWSVDVNIWKPFFFYSAFYKTCVKPMICQNVLSCIVI